MEAASPTEIASCQRNFGDSLANHGVLRVTPVLLRNPAKTKGNSFVNVKFEIVWKSIDNLWIKPCGKRRMAFLARRAEFKLLSTKKRYVEIRCIVNLRQWRRFPCQTAI